MNDVPKGWKHNKAQSEEITDANWAEVTLWHTAESSKQKHVSRLWLKMENLTVTCMIDMMICLLFPSCDGLLSWTAKCCCRKELWDGIISFPLVMDGPVYPVLKKIRKEALKLLSLESSNSTYHSCHWDTQLGTFLSKKDCLTAERPAARSWACGTTRSFEPGGGANFECCLQTAADKSYWFYL